MVTLLEAARDSERTYRESLVATADKTKPLISDYISRYKNSDSDSDLFKIIKNAPPVHQNPLLEYTQGKASDENSFEQKGMDFLRKYQIQEFYDNGFISEKFKFPNVTDQDLLNMQRDYVEHGNKCRNGIYKPIYGKFPDYVAHLYFPGVVKLLKDNYNHIVQRAVSVFNKPEEELYFQTGIFVVDETEKGANMHQDYSYYFLDQLFPDIKTCVITFHMAVTNPGISRFYLFPKTHKEILHNLTTLRYLKSHNIPIDDELAMLSGGISEYVIKKNQLPYDDNEGMIVTFSHFSRYPQEIYVLNKYKDRDIQGYKVDTSGGEYVLFDPAILHSNGASSGNIQDVMKNYEGIIQGDNISRLSLAIRVIHTKNERDHFLWMSALGDMDDLKGFFEMKLNENRLGNSSAAQKIDFNKNGKYFYTVLSNNRISSPDSPYFSINEIYNLHWQSGAYS